MGVFTLRELVLVLVLALALTLVTAFFFFLSLFLRLLASLAGVPINHFVTRNRHTHQN